MLIQITQERISELEKLEYSDYLNTPEWISIRKIIIERDNGRCRVCDSTRILHVHHRRYCVRGTETGDELTTLCQSCHHLFHSKSKMESRITVTSKPYVTRREQTRNHRQARPCHDCGKTNCYKFNRKGGVEICLECFRKIYPHKPQKISS